MTTKILFVDDDLELLSLYRTVLPPKYHYFMSPPSNDPDHKQELQKMSNYEVVTCASGEEAIETVQNNKDEGGGIAIAFIDYHFPVGMDGISIADNLRKIDPNIEIVYATATKKSELIDNSAEKLDGNAVYFKKPFDVNELIGLISRLLQKHMHKSLQKFVA
jgi:CheY-like chemotaxis protein